LALLDEVVAAHGGRARWAEAGAVVLRVRTGGALILAKRQRPALPPFEVRASTAEPRAVIRPFPAPGQVGVFDGIADLVRIETEDGRLVAERSRPRAEFRRVCRLVRWDELDMLYFAGYALWGYATQPFSLLRPGVEAWRLPDRFEDGERRRRLAVRFPPGLPVHSAGQIFHIDDAGRIRRNDYTAVVVGGWAKAAHLVDDHLEAGGLLIPRRRRVYPRARSGAPRPGPRLVWIDVDEAAVEPRA
jgi:hypothetical protein